MFGLNTSPISVRYFLAAISVLCIVSSAAAQYRWDVGGSIGAANYLGEIGGQEKIRRDFIMDMHLESTRWSAGIFGRYKFTKGTSVNMGFNYARISGSDALSENPARVARNATFRNDIMELYARMELTLLYNNDVGNKGYYNPDFKLFAFAGLAGFYHNPRSQDANGDWVALQPLRTEGVEYSLLQFAIPAGIGMYFTHKKVHRIGLEVGYRTTFTDYLDDASTQYPEFSELNQERFDEALYFSYRTTPEIIQQVNDDAILNGLEPVNFESFSQPGEKRGDATRNDGYLLVQASYSYVIKGRSAFYKRKYNWIRSKRRNARKTRAKF